MILHDEDGDGEHPPIGQGDDARIVACAVDRAGLVRDGGAGWQHAGQARLAGAAAFHDGDEGMGAGGRKRPASADRGDEVGHSGRRRAVARIAGEGDIGQVATVAGAQRRIGGQRGGDVAVEIARTRREVHSAVEQVGGVAVDAQPLDPQPRDPAIDRCRATGAGDQHVGGFIVALRQHQVEQSRHRQRRTRPHGGDIARHDVGQRQLSGVDHGEDLARDRDLIGAGHREERVAVEREAFAAGQVAHGDADRAIGESGEPLKLGDQAGFGGLLDSGFDGAEGVGAGQRGQEQAEGGGKGDRAMEAHGVCFADVKGPRKRIYPVGRD